MNQERKERLTAAGIDVDGTLMRFMNNEAMLEKFWKKFLDEKSYGELCAAVEAGDTAGAAMAAHTLKGVCGTLGFTRMHGICLTVEQQLKAGNLEGALQAMPGLVREYTAVCGLLSE